MGQNSDQLLAYVFCKVLQRNSAFQWKGKELIEMGRAQKVQFDFRQPSINVDACSDSVSFGSLPSTL